MKKVLSLVLTIALTLSIIPAGLFSITANAQMMEEFAGGSGTKVDPYLIETKEQLNNVRFHLGAHYKMTANIIFTDDDFSEGGDFYNNGAGWQPIGDSLSNRFKGTFDGNGYIIKDLYIKNAEEYAALFGCSGGIIRNLGVVNSYIRSLTDYAYAGGIVAYNYGGSITSCYSTGCIDALCRYAGGITGYNSGGSVANCYNIGNITTKSTHKVYAGGIAGRVYGGNISCCYNIGRVDAEAYPESYGADAEAFEGAIAGENFGEGMNFQATIGSYFYYQNIGQGIGNYPDNTTGRCNKEDLKKQSTFVNFDFETVWFFDESLPSYSFPVLRNVSHFEEWNVTEFAGGYGEKESPYLIATKEHLCNVGKYLDAHFKLICDIDYNGKTWSPIGKSTNSFFGVFDGNGHVIKNLCLEEDNDYIGLFGYSNGTIKNLGINVIENESATYGGAIVAYNNGQIINCYSTGDLFKGPYFDDSPSIGGIVGYNSGEILNCYNACNVSGSGYVGGIAGYNNATITNCYNVGRISAPEYNTAGGITGNNYYGGKISNCYNIGNVKIGDTSYAGWGIYGRNKGSTKNCYYSSEATESKMYYQSTFVGFDFETVWEIDRNGKYKAPTLQGVPMVGKSYVTDVEITAKPNKLVYLEGDPFDPAGMVVMLYYDDGREVRTTEYTVSGYTSTPGTKTITVEYNNVSESFEVIVEELTHIEITTKPDKLVYLEGDKFDPAGMVVTAYSGSTNGLVLDYTVSGYDSTPGTKNIVVTYMNNTATFTVEVEKKSFVDFGITTKPNKLTYLEGDLFDPTGMVVTAYYNNETNAEITDYTISGYDSTPGTKTITVEYNNVSKSFEVTVEAKALTSIEITKTPTKTEYLEAKDELSVVGGQITLYYNNGTSETIDMLASMVSGFDNTVVGVQTLTVTYNQKTATYDIEITKKELVSIELIDNGLKKTYIEGQTLDVTGGMIRRYYNNDTYSDMVLSWLYVSGFDNTVIGSQQLTVNYDGYGVYYNIDVIEKTLQSITVSALPQKTTYVDGQEFDATGMFVTANYDNGRSEVITDYTLSGYDSAPGSKTIVVSYEGKTASFTVTVEEKRLACISVTTEPNKMEYIEGEPFDPTGMVVTAHYYNCEDEIITEYTISGYDSTPSLDLITITYKEGITNFIVDVKRKEITSISVTTMPTKTTYIESTLLDDAGMVLTLYYNNNTFETVTTGWVSEYDFSNVGTSTVMVTYGEKTCTYNVTVIAMALTSIAVTKNPDKLTYLEGDSFDKTGMIVTAYYNNNTSAVVTDYTVSGYTSTPGTKTITVTYGGKVASFTVTVTGTVAMLGDVDGDDQITSTDARLVLQYYAGKIQESALNLDAADVDGDGQITSTDARLILQKYAGKIEDFPI